MATAGSLNSLLKTPPLPPATAIRRSPPSSSVFPAERCSARAISVNYGALRPRLAATRREIRARASTYDDEWRPETSGAGMAVAEKCEKTEIEELKGNLKELLYGSERGLRASSETRAEIVEVITLLEARNPYPAPTESLSLLNGKWILKYTSFSGLFPLLAMQRVPQLVKVDEITQTIDSGTFTCQNSVQFSGPLATTSVSTEAKFEIRSPKRVQIKFEQGIISTPQLTDSIVLPEKVEIFGQSVDLSPFKGVLGSIQDAASSIVKTISEQPPLKLPIKGSNAESWLLTTYLDDELRISRGDRGSVFVMIRERCADSWIN